MLVFYADVTFLTELSFTLETVAGLSAYGFTGFYDIAGCTCTSSVLRPLTAKAALGYMFPFAAHVA